MRTRFTLRPGSALLLAAASSASMLAGCEDERLTMQRPDTGVRDTGESMPLRLEVGMSFSYRATLTYRGTGAMSEGSALYDVGFTISAIDDRGPGESAITVTPTGQNMIDMSWTDDKDFDLWAARLGPARDTDRVAPAPVSVPLDGIPGLPPTGGMDKRLPAPGTFFIDVRDMEALRAAWSAEHADRRPRVVDPENNGGNWLFAYEGPDARITFYPAAAKRRSVRIEYDARGFLRSFSEEIGAQDASARPRSTANLNLTDGPN